MLNNLFILFKNINNLLLNQEEFQNEKSKDKNILYTENKLEKIIYNFLDNSNNVYRLTERTFIKDFSTMKNKLYESFDELNLNIITYKENYIYYIYQPYGSQKPPDFILFFIYKGIVYKINLECKSSKTGIPMWNSSLPNREINNIYIYMETNNNNILIISGIDLISDDVYK